MDVTPPVFQVLSNGIIKSSDGGVEVELHGPPPGWVQYRAGARYLELEFELAVEPAGFIIYLSTPTKWRSGELISEDQRLAAAGHLIDAFAALGYRVILC